MFGQQIYNYDSSYLNGQNLTISTYKQISSPLKEMNDIKTNKMERNDTKNISNSFFSSINNHLNSTNVIVDHENNQKFNLLNNAGCNFEFGFHQFENSQKAVVAAAANRYLNAAAVAVFAAKNNENLVFTNSPKQNFVVNSIDANYNEANITTSKILNSTGTCNNILNDDQTSFLSNHSQSHSSSSVSNSSPIVFNEASSLSKSLELKNFDSKETQKLNEDDWYNKNENNRRAEKKGLILYSS